MSRTTEFRRSRAFCRPKETGRSQFEEGRRAAGVLLEGEPTERLKPLKESAKSDVEEETGEETFTREEGEEEEEEGEEEESRR